MMQHWNFSTKFANYLTVRASLPQKNPLHHTCNYRLQADSSSFASVSLGFVTSSGPEFIDATIGATAGAGVVDLLTLAACNLWSSAFNASALDVNLVHNDGKPSSFSFGTCTTWQCRWWSRSSSNITCASISLLCSCITKFDLPLCPRTTYPNSHQEIEDKCSCSVDGRLNWFREERCKRECLGCVTSELRWWHCGTRHRRKGIERIQFIESEINPWDHESNVSQKWRTVGPKERCKDTDYGNVESWEMLL